MRVALSGKPASRRFAISGTPASRRFAISAALLLLAAAFVVAAQEVEFPDGEGKRILAASCTSCHGLDYVTKLRGYYTREQWRDVVHTMVEYGTKLEKKEEEVLVDYLTQHFGKPVAGSR